MDNNTTEHAEKVENTGNTEAAGTTAQKASVESVDEKAAGQKRAENASGKGRGKRKRTRVLLILLAVVAACAAAYLVFWLVRSMRSKETYDDLREKAEVKVEETDDGSVQPTVDFAALQAENPDIKAWIRVNGTAVDYPVCQSSEDEDEDFYLTHDAKKAEAFAGAIYIQKCDAADFSDPMTVVYGHNIKDGSMFHTLHNFNDESFFSNADNRTITIETPEKLLTYRIYAAVTFGNQLIPAYYDDQVAADRLRFIQDLGGIRDMASHIDSSMQVTENDPLLVLSTCVRSGNHNYRYLVVGVKTDEKPIRK